jgi:FG-GAP repeat
MTSIRPKLLIRAAFITAILLSAESALAQFLQQGPKLVGTGAVGNAGQGYSVALSGDGNTGIFGGPGDNSGAGTAWISTRSNGVWSQQGAKLVATDPGLGPGQGASVALSADGKTVIVGGPGDTNANTGENTGAAWIYTLVNGVWTQQGPKLIGTDLTGYPVSEGASVALSADGNTAIIGGNGDNGSTGAAWIFTRSNGVWRRQGHAPGRIELAVLSEALKQVTAEIEGVNDSMTHSGDIIMFCRILHGKRHEQLARNGDDVEWGIAARKVRVCECTRRDYPSECSVIHLHRTCAEIRGVKQGRCAIGGDGEPFVDCSVPHNGVVGVVNLDDPVFTRIRGVEPHRIDGGGHPTIVPSSVAKRKWAGAIVATLALVKPEISNAPAICSGVETETRPVGAPTGISRSPGSGMDTTKGELKGKRMPAVL